MRLVARGALLLVAAAIAGCDAPRPARPALWTLSDVQALYASGASGTTAIATGAGLPGGVPLQTILDPTDHTSLVVQPAWAEGYAVGYVTTEVWSYYDEVWAQPMYVPVTGWDNGAPQGMSPNPIFSVGAGSLFYSPFWRMIYVEVPDGTAKSAREIIDGKYPLHPSKGWMAALAPADVGLATSPSAGGAVMGKGWLDGAEAPFVKFPVAPFGIGEDEVIEEVPIYHFVFVGDDGTWQPLPVPAVLGTGPPYSQRPAPLDDLQVPTAKYSAYWRVYAVVVPATARVFALPGSELAAKLSDAGVPLADNYGPDVVNPTPSDKDPTLIADRVGRVSTKPSCFATYDTATGIHCGYLDSQSAIETNLPKDAIVRTDVTVTCPLVSLAGTAVMLP